MQFFFFQTHDGKNPDQERTNDNARIYLAIFNNYSPKAKWILSNNTRDEVEGNIGQYSLSLRGIIVLV